jgi:hypothetical protein
VIVPNLKRKDDKENKEMIESPIQQSRPKKTRKKLFQRVQAMFTLLNEEKKKGNLVMKTHLRKIGLSDPSSEQWIKVIQYIQGQPQLIVLKTKSRKEYTRVGLIDSYPDKPDIQTERKKGKLKTRRGRTLLERCKDIFDFLRKQGAISKSGNALIYRSRFVEIGMDGSGTEQWLEIILYVQRQPKLRVVQSGLHSLIFLDD